MPFFNAQWAWFGLYSMYREVTRYRWFVNWMKANLPFLFSSSLAPWILLHPIAHALQVFSIHFLYLSLSLVFSLFLSFCPSGEVEAISERNLHPGNIVMQMSSVPDRKGNFVGGFFGGRPPQCIPPQNRRHLILDTFVLTSIKPAGKAACEDAAIWMQIFLMYKVDRFSRDAFVGKLQFVVPYKVV